MIHKTNNSVTQNSIIILSWNANGLKNHKDEFLITLQEKRIDIALISETHFTNSYSLNIPGFRLHYTNHPDETAHAGAAIYVRSSLISHPLQKFQTDYIQSCAVSIIINNIPVSIAAIYCPPKHNISTNQFNIYFNTLGHNFIVGGDINSKNIQWGCRVTNPRGNSLLHSVISKNLQVISPTNPTYWPTSSRKRPDILDIFVTKIPSTLHSLITNLHAPCSDHSPILLSIDCQPLSNQHNPTPLHSHINWDNFHKSILEKTSLKICLKTSNDIDEAVNLFTSNIQTSAWESAQPTQSHTCNMIIPLYIRSLIAQKRRARCLWQRSKYPTDKSHYNMLAQKLKRTLANYRNKSYTSHLESLTTKDGSLWKATKQLLRIRNPPAILRNANGNWVHSDEDKANIFANHLADTFQPHNTILLPEKINIVEQFLNSPLQMSLPPKHISPAEVRYIISKLPRKKSPGYDLITSEILNQLPKKVIVLLTYIFNSMLRLSYFPMLWKFSTIILILKPKKPPDCPTSYRPISLLPILSKVFEKILLKRILNIIAESKILPDSQFGFRTKHSTIHQIHRIVDKISFSLEEKQYCTGAFLDVSQAFDRVWHAGLLFKLKLILPSTYYLILKSYLEDRFFSVRYGSSTSSPKPINAGVPQGAVTAPLLFNIFVSDQPTLPTTLIADFADDKAIITNSHDPSIASSHIQEHLSLLEKWYKEWGVKINESKSIQCTFTLRKGICPPIALNEQILPTAQSTRYLGIIIDQRLTWSPHLRNKLLSLNNRFRLLRSLLTSNHIKLPIKLLIYKLYLKPMWTYGIQLWGPAKISNTNRIQRFQSKTLRAITKAPFYVSNQTLHNDLAISPVCDVAKTFYRRFNFSAKNHDNPLIKGLALANIPDNPRKRLKRRWCRDLLI